MHIFKLTAPKTARLLSGHILPRSESNFTHNHLQKIFPERNLRTLTYRGRGGKGRGWEGIKGFIPLKEVQRERTGRSDKHGREKEGMGQRQEGGGILLQGLKVG